MLFGSETCFPMKNFSCRIVAYSGSRSACGDPASAITCTLRAAGTRLTPSRFAGQTGFPSCFVGRRCIPFYYR